MSDSVRNCQPIRRGEVIIIFAFLLAVAVAFILQLHERVELQNERNAAMVADVAELLSCNIPEGVEDGDAIVTSQYDLWGRPMIARFDIEGDIVGVEVTSKHYWVDDDSDDITVRRQHMRSEAFPSCNDCHSVGFREESSQTSLY